MHPVEEIRGEGGGSLEGKRIVLGITGSIAAVQCFELSRELVRRGAEVHPVMTAESRGIVTPCVMQFAAGRAPVVELGGGVEHVCLCGESDDRADLLLIAPCTANTVSKMALGIDDTPVTTMATTAIGTRMPVMVAPAMHAPMYHNPAVMRNLERLREMGVECIDPRFEGGKAKMASLEEIVARVERTLGPRDLAGRRVLVIGGSSEEPIDRMRVITNRGTGETAVSLARAAFARGAEVELWMGRHQVSLPDHVALRKFRSVGDLETMLDRVDHDLVMVPAALSDFGPRQAEGKLPSREGITLELEPLPKVLPRIRDRAEVLVGFKAEHGGKELIQKARARLEEDRLDAVVANDLSRVTAGSTEVILVTRSGASTLSGGKSEVAHSLLRALAEELL
ncbi:MAG: bifunctional phosphopantothenoylcysteine decarboxylase/phosphopantothenate--cysteine ligase CoaBC [Methanomassiliicoccales archaeon]